MNFINMNGKAMESKGGTELSLKGKVKKTRNDQLKRQYLTLKNQENREPLIRAVY